MLASFTDELQKIAEGNVMSAAKPAIGGMGSNVVGSPLPSTGISKTPAAKPAPAKSTNYSMVHSTAPMAAYSAGAAAKMVPPPAVKI